MSQKPVSPPERRGTGRLSEAVVFVGALGAIVASQLWLADGGLLFSRRFWLDEIYTHTLVADPDPVHALRALAGGVETHPPASYLLLRGVTALSGSADEVTFRVFAFACALVGLAGVYALLRQAFAPLPSFAAVLAVWIHPLVIWQGLEARPYAPWFAVTPWFAYLLVRARFGETLWVNLGLAVAAVLMCTLHYFGIITLALIVAGEISARRREGVPWARGLLATLAGPVALAGCYPLLAQQRASVTVPTWVGPGGWEDITGGWPRLKGFLLHAKLFLADIFFFPYFLALVVIAWLAQLWPSPRGPVQRRHGDLLTQAGASALVLVPFALVGLSAAWHSVLVSRYCLPALVALAPAAAWLLAQAGRPWVLLACALMAATGASELAARRTKFAEQDGETEELVQALRLLRTSGMTARGEPIVFESPAKMYVVCGYAPELAPYCYLLDFEVGDIDNASPARVFVRDLARNYAAFYPRFQTVKWSELRQRPRFYLVPQFLSPGVTGRVWDKPPYPGYHAMPLRKDILDFFRPAADKPVTPPPPPGR